MYRHEAEEVQSRYKSPPFSSKAQANIFTQTVLSNSSQNVIPAIKSNSTVLNMLSDQQTYKPTGQLSYSPSLQRMKIKLNKDEKEDSNFVVLGKVLQDGRKKALDDPDLFELEKGLESKVGVREDIIFLGHGKGMFDRWRMLEDYGAKKLAEYVCQILDKSFGTKLESWKGKVVLLGCYTKPLADCMYNLIYDKRHIHINIISTLADIVTTQVHVEKDDYDTRVKYRYKGFILGGHKISEKDKKQFKGEPYIIDFDNPKHVYNPNSKADDILSRGEGTGSSSSSVPSLKEEGPGSSSSSVPSLKEVYF